MSDEMDAGSQRQLEWILDVKYVLFLILIALSMDVYYALAYDSPLCSSGASEAYETLTIGNIIMFVCLFPLFYTLSLKIRKLFCKLTYVYVSSLPFVKNIKSREEDPLLTDYSVNEFDLQEYALLTDHDNLYEEFKQHESRHLRFVHVCDLMFSIALICTISVFVGESSVSVCAESIGISRWFVLPVAIVLLHWAAHAPLYGGHNVLVGKGVADMIKSEMNKYKENS